MCVENKDVFGKILPNMAASPYNKGIKVRIPNFLQVTYI